MKAGSGTAVGPSTGGAARRRPDRRRLLLLVASAWAGVWSVFVVSTLFSEGAEALPFGAGLLVVLATSIAVLWKDPRSGGVVLVGLGVAAAAFFRHPATWALLSVPAILLGAAHLWSPRGS
jgi:hypothetical protein